MRRAEDCGRLSITSSPPSHDACSSEQSSLRFRDLWPWKLESRIVQRRPPANYRTPSAAVQDRENVIAELEDELEDIYALLGGWRRMCEIRPRRPWTQRSTYPGACASPVDKPFILTRPSVGIERAGAIRLERF